MSLVISSKHINKNYAKNKNILFSVSSLIDNVTNMYVGLYFVHYFSCRLIT
jgi:hypothetical protein